MLKRRAPRLLLRLDGELLWRFAGRAFWASLLKLPPRLTRLEPVWPSSFHPLRRPEEVPPQSQGAGVLGVSQQALHGLHQSAFVELSFLVRLLPFPHPALEPGPARPLQANPTS